MKKTAILILLISAIVHTGSAQVIKYDTLRNSGLIETGKTIDGKKDGPWVSYLNGVKIKTVNYKKDLQYGEEIFYYPDGQVKSKGNYIDDEPDGEHLDFFQSGKTKSVSNYKKGVEHGIFIEYFESGRIHYSGSFVNGNEEGEFAEFSKDGAVINKGRFSNGEKTGIWIETEEKNGGLGYPATIRKKTKDYTRDEETILIYYKNGGELWKTEYYVHGKLVKTVDQRDVELNAKKFTSKENLVKYLNASMKQASLGTAGNIKFNSLGKKDNYDASLQFVLDNGKIYLHSYLPGSLNCTDRNTETIATLAPQSGTDHRTNFYLTFNVKLNCSNKLYETIKVYFNILPDEDIERIKQYFRDQEEQYYTIRFVNNCTEEVSVLLRYVNDSRFWQMSGWKTIKPKETIEIAKTKNAVVYFYASTKGLVWKGEHEFIYGSKPYKLIKWEIKEPKGNVGKIFNCN